MLLWQRHLRSWLFVGYGQVRHIRDWDIPLIYTGSQWRFENTHESLGECSWLESVAANLTKNELIGRGWNKNVYRRGDYAVKKINFRGTALVSCMDESDGDFAREGDCLERSAEKFIKEIGVLLSLQGDLNVPKLHGYCIPSDYVQRSDDLFMVTDVGAPLNMLHLVQMDWTKRLILFREIVDFVQRIRPFVLRDLRRQQFIFNNIKPMYADFDDVTSCPHCNETEEYSAAVRLYDAFVRDLFQFGNPENSDAIIEVMKSKYENSSLTLLDLKLHADELFNLTRAEL
uniref:PIP49_C domain-containing protein n=1 Tax=Steinernema glaseri TaxID=37863 RepID=A0A1I8ADF5_9BILA